MKLRVQVRTILIVQPTRITENLTPESIILNIQSWGERSFYGWPSERAQCLQLHWKEFSAERLHCKKRKKPWRWNFSGCTFLRIQLLWSEIASNSIKTIYVTNSCPHTVWGPALGQKKEKLWIRERTSGAANNQTAVLSYSDREYKRLLAQKVYQRSPFQLSNSRKYQEPLLSWWPL